MCAQYHAVGSEVLVLAVEVEGVLVVQAHVLEALDKQLLAVGDPLRHLGHKERHALAASRRGSLSKGQHLEETAS